MIDKELMKKLGSLYERTNVDWQLEVTHCLTEPTCPTARVYPEDKPNFVRYCADADTIEEAINRTLQLAYDELIGGRVVQPDFPVTQDSDVEYLLHNNLVSPQSWS